MSQEKFMSNRAFDEFNRIFERHVEAGLNKELAFNKAEEAFSNKSGFRAYSNYDSFRRVKTRKKKTGV